MDLFEVLMGSGKDREEYKDYCGSYLGKPKRPAVRGIWTGFQRLPDKFIRNLAPYEI
jgi:hypothetical protein